MKITVLSLGLCAWDRKIHVLLKLEGLFPNLFMNLFFAQWRETGGKFCAAEASLCQHAVGNAYNGPKVHVCCVLWNAKSHSCLSKLPLLKIAWDVVSKHVWVFMHEIHYIDHATINLGNMLWNIMDFGQTNHQHHTLFCTHWPYCRIYSLR